MRERLARLQTAERPAAAGDFVVVDYVGSLAVRRPPARRRAGSPSRAARAATSSSSSAPAT